MYFTHCKTLDELKAEYWRPMYGTSAHHRGTQSLGMIRAKYGSQRFTANGREERTEATAERLTA